MEGYFKVDDFDLDDLEWEKLAKEFCSIEWGSNNSAGWNGAESLSAFCGIEGWSLKKWFDKWWGCGTGLKNQGFAFCGDPKHPRIKFANTKQPEACSLGIFPFHPLYEKYLKEMSLNSFITPKEGFTDFASNEERTSLQKFKDFALYAYQKIMSPLRLKVEAAIYDTFCEEYCKEDFIFADELDDLDLFNDLCSFKVQDKKGNSYLCCAPSFFNKNNFLYSFPDFFKYVDRVMIAPFDIEDIQPDFLPKEAR